jgi:tetratricopeptide (TPR) repeat protein
MMEVGDEHSHVTGSAAAGTAGLDATRALRRARRLEQRGQLVEAISSLERAMDLGAEPYDCYLRQARLYQSLGRWGDAVSTVEKAIERKPNRVGARETMVALLLQSRDFRRAILAGKDLLRIAPRHVAVRDALGVAYLEIGDLDAALRVTNELIRLDPSDPHHRFKKAILCRQKGEMRMAVAELQRVLDMTDDPALADTVRQAMDQIDLTQLHTILLLAADDPVFRTKVLSDPERAITERGFGLSDWGIRRLAEIASDDLDTYPGSGTPRSYH